MPSKLKYITPVNRSYFVCRGIEVNCEFPGKSILLPLAGIKKECFLMFIGRKKELRLLHALKEKGNSSLVCIMGRRRIGKSTLIAEFGKSFSHVITIQGLCPHEHLSAKDQLAHFSEELSNAFNRKKENFEN